MSNEGEYLVAVALNQELQIHFNYNQMIVHVEDHKLESKQECASNPDEKFHPVASV